MNEEETQKWAMWCHLSALVWIPPALIGITIPFINLVGPFIFWWLKKDDSELVNFEGKESLNFQVSMSLYSIGGLIIFGILGLISLLVVSRLGGLETDQKPELLPGGLERWQKGAMIVFGLIQLVLVIVAAVKARKCEPYRYPLTIRFLK